jgi:hypothetical protein
MLHRLRFLLATLYRLAKTFIAKLAAATLLRFEVCAAFYADKF